MQPLIMALTLLVLVVSTAPGAIYTYRDAQGRLHFTNQLERVPVAYREAALANQRPEAPLSIAPTASPRAPSTVTPVSPLPSASPPSASATPASRPVDTHALGLIRIGMSPEEVRERLGAPNSMLKYQGQERWLYPGNNQIPAAVIVFKRGEVTFRGRAGTEP
jgi:Domain of unknown function (DUF4124)